MDGSNRSGAGRRKGSVIGMVSDWLDSLIQCAVRSSRALERLARAAELQALVAADERSGGTYRSVVSSAVADIQRQRSGDDGR